jgi:hypothetical protein
MAGRIAPVNRGWREVSDRSQAHERLEESDKQRECSVITGTEAIAATRVGGQWL